jgi:hypothetical protein
MGRNTLEHGSVRHSFLLGILDLVKEHFILSV